MEDSRLCEETMRADRGGGGHTPFDFNHGLLFAATAGPYRKGGEQDNHALLQSLRRAFSLFLMRYLVDSALKKQFWKSLQNSYSQPEKQLQPVENQSTRIFICRESHQV